MVSEDADVVKKHLMEAHNVKVEMEALIRKFPCSLCKYSTTNMGDYKNHLINTHNKERHNWIVEEIIVSFSCEECDLEFPRSSELKSHIDKTHSGDKGIIKEEDKVLIVPEQSSHRNTEKLDSIGNKTKEPKQIKKSHKKLMCTKFPYVPISERSLDLHMKRIHAPKLNCDKCEMIFVKDSSLEHHKLNSHNDKFQCDLCDYKAKTLKFLNLHKAAKHTKIPLVMGMGIKRDGSVKSKSKTPSKRAKLNISPNKKEEEPTQVVTESSDSELEFEEPKPWTEKPYYNSDNEVMGHTIKGKGKTFIHNSGKVANLLKKRMKIYKVNNNKIKVTKHIYKKNALCSEIEVEKNDGNKTSLEATIFLPSNSIEVRRKPDVDPSFVGILRDVLLGFLEQFLSW